MSDVLVAGFDAHISEIQDQLRLCQPILTFEGDERMYLARRLDWSRQDEATGRSLTFVDNDDVATFGTVLPVEARMPIQPGIGVLTVGRAFFDAVQGLVDDPWGETTLCQFDENPYWIGLADVSRFEQIRTRIANSAARSVDDEIGKALGSDTTMSRRGRLASHVLRQCDRRRTDVAIRELATALVDREFDLFRRRLSRYSIELGASRDVLEAQAGEYLRLVGTSSHGKVSWTVALRPAQSRQRRPYRDLDRGTMRHYEQRFVYDRAKPTPTLRMRPIDVSLDKAVTPNGSLRPRQRLARTPKELLPRDPLERIGAP